MSFGKFVFYFQYLSILKKIFFFISYFLKMTFITDKILLIFDEKYSIWTKVTTFFFFSFKNFHFVFQVAVLISQKINTCSRKRNCQILSKLLECLGKQNFFNWKLQWDSINCLLHFTSRNDFKVIISLGEYLFDFVPIPILFRHCIFNYLFT